MGKHINGLKTKKRLIRLKEAHQRSHCKVGYLALVHEKKNASIIFVHTYTNAISIRIKVSSRVQKSWKKITQERRKQFNKISSTKRLKNSQVENYLPIQFT